MTLGSCATCQGYKYIALTGLPADPHFDTRSILVCEHDELSDPAELFKRQFDQHILTVRVTPNNVICAFFDHAEVWDFRTGIDLASIKYAVNVHAPLDVSPEGGRYLVCTGQNSSIDVCIYDIQARTTVQSHAADNPVSLLTFSSKGRYFASASSAGHTIKIWEAESHVCIIKFKRANTASVIYSVSFSPTNEFLAVLSRDGMLHFFSMTKAVKSGSAPTIRAFHNFTIGDNAVAFVRWFSPTQIAIVNMEGKMLVISVDEKNCKEVGREQIGFQNRILQSHAQGVAGA
jgi:WD40 repeat protein